MSEKHQVIHDPESNRFVVEEDGHRGVLEYDWSEPGREIDYSHTEVPTALEGLGVGSALVRAALDFARARGLIVRPSCPFVRSYIERHPDEYGDLVPEDVAPDS